MAVHIRDGGARSLYLIIQPSGSKSWGMRFRAPGGKVVKLHLGPVDFSGREASDEPLIGTPLTLSAARALSAAVHRDRARGVDVQEEYRSRRHRSGGTFGALARRYLDEHVNVRMRRPRDAARVLSGVIARWENRPIEDVTPDAIHAVVDEAMRRGIPGMGRRTDGPSDARGRTLGRALSSLFAWLARRRLITSNPCTAMYIPPSAPPRERVLDEDEIRRLWSASGEMGPFGSICRLLLLTGSRLNEIASLRWSEVDGDELRLPGARTKNGRAHVVPLCPAARAIVESAPRIEGCDYVFTTTGHTPVSGFSNLKRRLDRLMGSPAPFRLHDLRRTAASGMQRLGVRVEVIERALNHASGSYRGVAGIYQRDPMSVEVRDALTRWAGRVEEIVS